MQQRRTAAAADSVDDQLYGEYTWDDLADWIRNPEVEGDEVGEELFYGIAVTPNDVRHSLVLDCTKAYKVLPGDGLDENWGEYLDDLLEYFDCPEDSITHLSGQEFFDIYGKTIQSGPLT